MPPFSEDTVDRYTNYPRRGSIEDDSPPPSPSVPQAIYQTFRRSLFFDGGFEPCPGVQPLQVEEGPRKQVTINLEKNETHVVLHFTEYSELEKSLTWISMDELKQIKSDSRLIVQAWQSGVEGYYMRGLEAKQSEAYRLKRKQNKADIRFAVLTEQSKQKFATGQIIDHDRLALVSMDCSEASRIEAQKVGLADEQAAVRVVMDQCTEEAKDELMGYDCAGLFLLAHSAYAY